MAIKASGINCLSISEAEDYLPKRKEPLKVTVGIEEKKTPTLSMLDSIRLGKESIIVCSFSLTIEYRRPF